MTKVSFYCPTFNNSKGLEQALLNVVNYVDQILVVHDGPIIDDTEEVVYRVCGHKGAEIVATPERMYGPVPSRIYAIQHMKYEWIMTLDDDELFTEDFLDESQDVISAADDYGYDNLYLAAIPVIKTDTEFIIIHDNEPVYQGRVFKKGDVYMFGGIHEYMVGFKSPPYPVAGLYHIYHIVKPERIGKNNSVIYPDKETLVRWIKYLEKVDNRAFDVDLYNYREQLRRMESEDSS